MKQAVLVVVAVVAVVGGIVFAISRTADVSPLDQGADQTEEAAATSAWEAKAGAAFGGEEFARKVVDMMQGAREWQAGARPAAQFQAELAEMVRWTADNQAALRQLEPFPYDKRVNGLYVDSAVLYSQTVAVFQAMVAAADPAERTQLDRLARRIRILADRVFDRGRELLKPFLHEEPDPATTVRLPDEVPDWVQEGIAPGPPLEPAEPPPPDGEPRLRQEDRPEQDREDWLRAVRRITLPPQHDIRTGHPDTLADMARRLVAAAEALRDEPDPDGDRELSARVRLGLLVEADAARARRLGLGNVANELLQVGARLWDEPGLPPRAR